MKIIRNLSDADMLKGYQEQETFENSGHDEERTRTAVYRQKKGTTGAEILLTEEAVKRLNQFVLEIGMEWLKNKKGACSWKVARENDQILIRPVAEKK